MSSKYTKKAIEKFEVVVAQAWKFQTAKGKNARQQVSSFSYASASMLTRR